jgi:hypothetical protein
MGARAFHPPGIMILTARLERTLRRSRRLCAETGCPRESGERYRCSECAAKYARRVQKFRALRARKKEQP